MPAFNSGFSTLVTRATGKRALGDAEARDLLISIFLDKTGLSIFHAINLNVGDVYSGKRVRGAIHVHGSSGFHAWDLPLCRIARETVALILDFNLSIGGSLAADAPLFVRVPLDSSGTQGSRLALAEMMEIRWGTKRGATDSLLGSPNFLSVFN